MELPTPGATEEDDEEEARSVVAAVAAFLGWRMNKLVRRKWVSSFLERVFGAVWDNMRVEWRFRTRYGPLAGCVRLLLVDFEVLKVGDALNLASF